MVSPLTADRVDPRTPVVVGVAQVVNRTENLDEVVDAVALMERALVGAADDAGNTAVLGALDRIAVMQGRWRWGDPARLLADRVGARGATSVFAMASGSIPQDLVADAAARISAGACDAVAVCGGEWAHGRRRLRAAGRPLPVTPQRGANPDECFGVNRDWESPLERARGFGEPLVVYAMFESAIAAARGEDYTATRTRAGAIAEQLSRVAATTEDAWRREALPAETIVAPTAANRFVVFPYTKWMVANPDVDMAFAVILCAAEVAVRLGVPTDRWVFPVAAAGCDDRCWFSELDRFDRSAHHALTAAAAMGAAGVGIDDVKYLDLYSCFPAAVYLQSQALGIDPLHRDITVTGGMPFFGGPLASYMGHAIVRAVQLVRDDPTELAMCVGNGGYTNKLATGLYAGVPPRGGFRIEDVSARAEATPHRRAVAEPARGVVIEATTVVFDRAGPVQALATAITSAGARVVGCSSDLDLVGELLSESRVGHLADFSGTGKVDLVG